MMLRPVQTHRSGGHSAQRMARRRIEQREIEMAGEQDDRDERDPVVEEDRARELEAVVALAEPEERSGDGEENGERGGERRIDLLSRVESPLRCRAASQPVDVVVVEPVELTYGRAQAAAVAERDAQDESDD